MPSTFDPAVYGDHAVDIHDLLYPTVEVPDIVAFLRKRLADGARVVEFGAGTGRVAVPLAEHGYEVHGVDAAPTMLTALRAKDPAGLVQVHQADFTRDVVGTGFDLCLLANNTLLMMPTQDLQCTVLRRAAQHLCTDGLLVVEAYEPSSYHRLTGKHTQSSVLSSNKLLIDSIQNDPVTQTLHFLRTLVTDGRVLTFPEVSRYCWPAELDMMAKAEGFTLVERWGGWQESAFDRTSDTYLSVYRLTGPRPPSDH
ncbi:class I SAM-dependent methyltransferase [Streptomyces sp. NPDC047315]|uniref:class I SAM-dependent methyltransferase n=1 Tax=Streptomyces sp. NPDC047315 TaxID=3155142 RepID=UPI0033D36585